MLLILVRLYGADGHSLSAPQDRFSVKPSVLLCNSCHAEGFVHFSRLLNLSLHMLPPIQARETSVRSQIRSEFVRPSQKVIEVAG